MPVAARVLVVVSVIAVCVGCGGGTPLVETQGTVTGPDGKPMPNVLVMFTPTSTGGTKVISSTAVTDESGKFVLKADTGQTGAVAGTHKVTLVDNALNEEDEPKGGSRPRAKSRIPTTYSSPTTTPLEATVEPGKTHTLKVQ